MLHAKALGTIFREKAHPPSLKLWRTRNAQKRTGRSAKTAIHTNSVEILMYRFVWQNVSLFHHVERGKSSIFDPRFEAASPRLRFSRRALYHSFYLLRKIK
jgi:hypothetical protein